MKATTKLCLEAVPPFNFGLSAGIFSNGDRQIRKYEKNMFWQVIRVNGKLLLANVWSSGSVDKPKLKTELKTGSELTRNDTKNAEKTIRSLFNLNLNLAEFYDEIKTDEVMWRLTRELLGLKIPTTQTVFEALIDSIVEQQISIKVASYIKNKLTKKFGDTLTVEGKVFYVYPTPQKLASVDVDEIRECGLSQRKSEYIKGISELVVAGELNLEQLERWDSTEDIINELDKVRGVGVWTAELTMLRGMQKLEALPADDLGLKRVISRYYCNGETITGAHARQIAEKWGPWKGLAAYYLIVADMKDIKAQSGTLSSFC